MSAGDTARRTFVIGLIVPALLAGSTVFTQRGGGATPQGQPAAQRETCRRCCCRRVWRPASIR